MFNAVFGIDYGVTVGIFFGKGSGVGAKWFDVVAIAGIASFGFTHGCR